MGYGTITPTDVDVVHNGPVNFTIQFDGSLQGLGCGGDDGWLAFGSLPNGLVRNGMVISGIYASDLTNFQFRVSVMGTNEDCSAPVEVMGQNIVFHIVPGPSIPTGVPASLTLTVGQEAEQTFGLTDPSFLQGLGCFGDDGTIALSGSIPGMTIDGMTLSGMPTKAGTYYLALTVDGTNADCSAPVQYINQRIQVTVLERTSLEMPCGPVSGVVSGLKVFPTDTTPGTETYDELTTATPADTVTGVQLEFEVATLSTAEKIGAGGPYQEVTVEAAVGKPHEALLRWLANARRNNVGIELKDANGQTWCIGDKDYPLRLNYTHGIDGRTSEIKIQITGEVPFARFKLTA